VLLLGGGIGACTRDSAVFAPRTCSPFIRSWQPNRALPSTTITGGRFALNVVTGWHRPELEMFGAAFLDHDVRYDLAVEWLEVIKRLWTAEEEFDYEGKHFKISKGYLEPKAAAEAVSAVMNAGTSGAGKDYAVKYCDVRSSPQPRRPGPSPRRDPGLCKLAREQ
jgi:alkanesulfonate monooxygenase SsuD/methylene tetrahydromethanopterin reductase-like flavin-dependent oxidoreductase (luciferase family)